MSDVKLLLPLLGLHVFAMLAFVGLFVFILRQDASNPPDERGQREGGWEPPHTPPPGPEGGPPLPDATPARVRLREPAPLTSRASEPLRRRPGGPHPSEPLPRPGVRQ